MSCGVGRRCGSHLAVLWLWHRPAATAPVRPLAWEPPYATGVALEKAKKDKKQNQKNPTTMRCHYTPSNKIGRIQASMAVDIPIEMAKICNTDKI